ncbi:2-oxo acid dehydrogenase subunit E2, partial [Thermococcus sp.]
PQVAILGVNRIVEKPVVRDGRIEVAHVMTLSLTFDHRAIDGAPAAKFLQRLKHHIENPVDALRL